jgi:hypothetical protein
MALLPVPKVVIKPDGKTLEMFLVDRSPVCFIQGPVRSGKTTTAIQKLMLNALHHQQPVKGVRRRKTIVVRNTYKQLIDTVIPSVREIMPEATWGPINVSGRPRRMIRMPGLEWEWLFYAADKPEDVQDFKSLEASDIWASEYRYLPREIMSVLVERKGQFPNKAAGGCQVPQLIGETNAPMEGHWSSVMSGQEPMPSGLSEDDRRALMLPPGWKFFIQPPGVIEVREGDRIVGYTQNPVAENVSNLNDPRYYENALGIKSAEEVRTELMNRPGRQRVGKSVWPTFKRDVHVAKSVLPPVAGHPIIVGQDFGRTPATVFTQCVFGQWRVIGECWGEGMGARRYAQEALKPYMAEAFPGAVFSLYGDPAGENMAEADDISPFLMFRAAGLRMLPAPTNDPAVRTGAVEAVLGRMVDGAPGFLVSPNCGRLIAAMDGGYIYRRLAVSGERYGDAPDKNHHSHIADALQYAIVGGGEGRALLTRVGPEHARPGGGRPRSGHSAVPWRGRGWSGLSGARR